MVAKVWSSYLDTVLGFVGGILGLGTVQVDWGALLIVSVVATLCALGSKLSSKFSAVVTGIKMAVVILVMVVGAFYIKAANYSPFIPSPEAGHDASGVNQSVFSLLTGAHSSNYG
ncbi:hypothetical protein [Mycobacterium leprae]|uniref:hypothetical protein n=1 Tax=Mycobacterium leprae TaxID=1769 RepID=UPI000B2C0691|nr:hypothetical protein [Mycobacterium leprae]